MDRRAPDPPGERDMMFCHECQNQWYRDEHGLECPACHSDFTEVIEAANDPRHDHQQLDDEIPDPDIGDIDHLGWPSSPGETPHRIHARIERTPSGNAREAQQGQTGGVAGMIGSALQSFIGGMMQAPVPDDDGRRNQEQDNMRERTVTQRSVTPSGTTIIRQVHGDNYSFTMTTTSGSNLHPRNANSPQPFQHQPEPMDDIMRSMLMNIGAFSPGIHDGHPGARRAPFPPGIHGFPSPELDATRPMPLPAMLFSLLGMPHNGQFGDAVYSQEGLDRIISQLMEQHQTGNAPGPAPESAIASLPTRSITEKDLGESGSAECSICMDSVSIGDTVTVLPCQHWFHGDCIKAWLHEHDTCPHCRQGIMPRDGDSTSLRQPTEPPLNDMHSPASSRPAGAFPFPRQNSASGHSRSRSPEMSRRRASSGGVFDRMREAFGGNSSRRQP